MIDKGTVNVDSAKYVLYLDNGASIGFRADGWQAWTADLVGNQTYFAYNANSPGRIISITDPTGAKFEFTYSSNKLCDQGPPPVRRHH
jgi:hypothetical protein